ncbi:AAA family ATPase [Streptomyces violascens]|uniref:AAA family ATPase n=1 Tax=Streptomyces violascens TaxID=67381 RepID=UPI0037B67563
MGAGVPRGAVKKAEQAWLQAVGLWQQGHRDAAGEWFEGAVRHDPSTADAWLGLHATGRREAEALSAMNWNNAAFGQLRTKYSVPLHSRFDLGHYVAFRLETARDLWLATVAGLLGEGRIDEAGGMLSTAVLDCDETRFLCTRYAFLKQDWNSVLSFARGIQDPFMCDESQLYVGVALIQHQVFHEALEVLAPLPGRIERGSRFEAEVAYMRGRACDGLGIADEALRHYQHSFRLWPDFRDVAQRAKAQPVPVASGPSPAAGAEKGAPTGHAARSPQAQAVELTDDEQRDAVLQRALAALDAMTGLEPVKRQIRTLVAQLRMAVIREEQGLPSATRPSHFVFAGPPGTGKTTVARVIGEVFKGLGLLKSGHVVEAQRVDLVGQHLGSSAIKTSQVVDSALDGVLFIDEAYSLSNSGYSGGDAFGAEALQVLLKRAEDDRDRLVVILVGYETEIAQLLATNPGLSSRFTTRVEFPSYSGADLLEIARALLATSADVLAPEAESLLAGRLDMAVREGRIDELGNARFVRELCFKAAAIRDLRLAESHDGGAPTREEITTLLFADVDIAYHELTSR